jgi:hypothetical protein
LGGAEAVGELAAERGDGTFSHAVGTVVELSALLVEAVPVDRGSIGSQYPGTGHGMSQANLPVGAEVVDDLDLDPVAPVGADGGSEDGAYQGLSAGWFGRFRG